MSADGARARPWMGGRPGEGGWAAAIAAFERRHPGRRYVVLPSGERAVDELDADPVRRRAAPAPYDDLRDLAA